MSGEYYFENLPYEVQIADTLRHTRMRCDSTIDWDRVFDDILEQPNTPDSPVAHAVRALASPDSTHTKEHIATLKLFEEDYSSYVWQERPPYKRPEYDPSLFSTLEQWVGHAQLALSMVDSERAAYLRSLHIWQNILTIADLSERAELFHGSTQPKNDHYRAPNAAQALTRLFYAQIAELDRADIAWIDASIQAAERKTTYGKPHSELFIDNRAIPTPATDFYSLSWITEQLQELPYFLWQGMRDLKVTLHERIKECTGPAGPERTIEGGRYYDSADTEMPRGIEIHATAAKYFDNPERQTKKWLTHEVAHFAHSNRIPLAWLTQWVAVCCEHPAEVSPHAERKHNDEGEASGYAEQLCDATALYVVSPCDMLAICHERSALINNLIGRYDTTLLDRAVSAVHNPQLKAEFTARLLINAAQRRSDALQQSALDSSE